MVGQYSLQELYAMIFISLAVITVPGLLVEAYWWWQDRRGLDIGEGHANAHLEQDIEIEEQEAA